MPTTTDLKQLVINTVESQEVYDYLKINGLINEDEIYLVAGEVSYTLPIASADSLGGVKVGSGLSVEADGTISFSGDIDCGLFTDTTTNRGD